MFVLAKTISCLYFRNLYFSVGIRAVVSVISTIVFWSLMCMATGELVSLKWLLLLVTWNKLNSYVSSCLKLRVQSMKPNRPFDQRRLKRPR